MKALPKILRYFTGKVWGFPFRTAIQSEQDYKALKRSEIHRRKVVNVTIEESASIVKSLDSSNVELDDPSKAKNLHDIWNKNI